MANVHILYDPPSDQGIFSGGAWQRGLANLKKRMTSETARSASLDSNDTTFTVDMLFSRPLSMFALIGHNLNVYATVRIRVSDSSTFLAAATTLDVRLPVRRANTVWGSLPWGAFPWDGVREDYKPEGNTLFLYKHPVGLFGRYVRVDIEDYDNESPFVEIGRFMCGEPLVPRINFAPGAPFKWNDPSEASVARGGQKWWDPRRKSRGLRLSFPHGSEAEAWGAAYELQELVGVTRTLLVSYDPFEASPVRERRTIYGSLVQLDEIVTATTCVAYPYAWNLAVDESF